MKVQDPELLAYKRTKPCEVCGHPPPSEVHHVLTRGAGGGDTALNTMSMCKTIPGYYTGCHTKLQEGKENREKCCEIIAKREGLESGEVVWDALLRKLNERKP